mmetsp:Transcript_73751/g.223532  ORF Transcript_73751/g.223532 Transcript_73751/m.223532 type:complete len:118 (-) Transcript_73751:131-484(-)
MARLTARPTDRSRRRQLARAMHHPAPSPMQRRQQAEPRPRQQHLAHRDLCLRLLPGLSLDVAGSELAPDSLLDSALGRCCVARVEELARHLRRLPPPRLPGGFAHCLSKARPRNAHV